MLCDEKNLTLTDEAEDKLVDAIVSLTERTGRERRHGAGSPRSVRAVPAKAGIAAGAEPAADKAARHTLVESDIPNS